MGRVAGVDLATKDPATHMPYCESHFITSIQARNRCASPRSKAGGREYSAECAIIAPLQYLHQIRGRKTCTKLQVSASSRLPDAETCNLFLTRHESRVT